MDKSKKKFISGRRQLIILNKTIKMLEKRIDELKIKRRIEFLRITGELS